MDGVKCNKIPTGVLLFNLSYSCVLQNISFGMNLTLYSGWYNYGEGQCLFWCPIHTAISCSQALMSTCVRFHSHRHLHSILCCCWLKWMLVNYDVHFSQSCCMDEEWAVWERQTNCCGNYNYALIIKAWWKTVVVIKPMITCLPLMLLKSLVREVMMNESSDAFEL